MPEITIRFDKIGETKNTCKYDESGDPLQHKVGRLYLKKTEATALGNPEALHVVITPIE